MFVSDSVPNPVISINQGYWDMSDDDGDNSTSMRLPMMLQINNEDSNDELAQSTTPPLAEVESMENPSLTRESPVLASNDPYDEIDFPIFEHYADLESPVDYTSNEPNSLAAESTSSTPASLELSSVEPSVTPEMSTELVDYMVKHFVDGLKNHQQNLLTGPIFDNQKNESQENSKKKKTKCQTKKQKNSVESETVPLVESRSVSNQHQPQLVKPQPQKKEKKQKASQQVPSMNPVSVGEIPVGVKKPKRQNNRNMVNLTRTELNRLTRSLLSVQKILNQHTSQ